MLWTIKCWPQRAFLLCAPHTSTNVIFNASASNAQSSLVTNSERSISSNYYLGRISLVRNKTWAYQTYLIFCTSAVVLKGVAVIFLYSGLIQYSIAYTWGIYYIPVNFSVNLHIYISTYLHIYISTYLHIYISTRDYQL